MYLQCATPTAKWGTHEHNNTHEC